MTTLPPELALVLDAGEDEHLEVKEAKQTDAYEELAKYCSALANEGGGRVVLGVTDARPRRIVGTNAFPDPGQTTARLMSELHVRVTHQEYGTPGGRVLVFEVARRPAGTPVQYRGQYLMRAGSSLVPMTAETLRQVFDEIAPDFSATVCPHASLDALDPAAIHVLRASWAKKARDPSITNLTDLRVLHDLG
ncbi:MAG: AlbA family DNA-binding domain-containing protein, partial [Thermoanaerobaculia bacterium]